MSWAVVGFEAIDSWREREQDDETRALVLEWLIGFASGPGFADGVPSLTQPGLFVARVPGTTTIVTFYVGIALDPPVIAIRDIS